MDVRSASRKVLGLGKTQRRPELDALRGLFLVWMTLTHLPTRLSDLVNQPFGFVSSAEGFVFLSALLVGRVYMRQALENAGSLRGKLWERALRVYAYHVSLLFVRVPLRFRLRGLPPSCGTRAPARFLHRTSGGRYHRLAFANLLSAAAGHP